MAHLGEFFSTLHLQVQRKHYDYSFLGFLYMILLKAKYQSKKKYLLILEMFTFDSEDSIISFLGSFIDF